MSRNSAGKSPNPFDSAVRNTKNGRIAPAAAMFHSGAFRADMRFQNKNAGEGRSLAFSGGILCCARELAADGAVNQLLSGFVGVDAVRAEIAAEIRLREKCAADVDDRHAGGRRHLYRRDVEHLLPAADEARPLSESAGCATATDFG